MQGLGLLIPMMIYGMELLVIIALGRGTYVAGKELLQFCEFNGLLIMNNCFQNSLRYLMG